MISSFRLIAALAVIGILFSCQSHPSLQNGDLIFFTGDNGSSMDDAIGKATGEGYIHVAIVEVDSDGNPWVIEATPKNGVCRDALKVRLSNEKGRITYKRLIDSAGVAESVSRAKSLVGAPYDFTFLPDNNAYYCSELVYECYLRPDGSHIFSSKPMNFLDNEGNLPDYWQVLFDSLKMNVPQGINGTNPEDMSKDVQLAKIK